MLKHSHRKLRGLVALAGVLIAVAIGAYWVAQSEPTSMSVRMKWFFAGTMAPWFAGVQQGFFRAEGLEVRVEPGGPDNSSIKLVAAGSDVFGVAGADEVLMARAKGVPVVAIGVIFRDTPVVFISKRDSGIEHPRHWSGKTIEVLYGGNEEFQYRALKQKFAVKNVNEVSYSFNLQPFIEDAVEVSVAYVMDQVATLERKGIRLNLMDPKDYGINPYGDVIITRASTLKENPQLVKSFIAAAKKAFAWSMENPGKAVQALVSSTQGLNADEEFEVWERSIPIVRGDGKASVLDMRLARWQETANLIEKYGDIPAGELDVSETVATTLDN